MITRIFIQNFALIDSLEIDLHKGMQVITGETGAGKSIILGALRLILGDRADIKSLSNTDKKSIVEVEFHLSERFIDLFNELDLDYEDMTIIRREILPNGKSRAFINDMPTNLDSLKKVTEKLIDIHSQFETGKLFTEEYQFAIVDGISNNATLLQEYQKIFQEYNNLKRGLESLKQQLKEGQEQGDYKKYLLEELEEANLDTLQWEELQQQLSKQENAEYITGQLMEVLSLFENEEMGIMEGLRSSLAKLQKANDVTSSYDTLVERLDSAFIELKDWTQDLHNEAEKIEIDGELLLHLQTKVNTIQRLLQKHQVDSIDGLIAMRDELSAQYTGVENIEEAIKELDKEIANCEKKLSALSNDLKAKRSDASAQFKEKMEQLLAQLGLEKARIQVELSEAPQYNVFGKEEIAILFQANTGFPMKPIQTAISGGERSRVMLGIKKIMAETNELPTLILDEIDTGVSGKVAEEIGNVMQTMGNDMQLIVISHLAQVAAKGSHNYKVMKRDINGVTQSTIVPLSKDEKLQEIAQLLSGASVTPAALEQAKELIGGEERD